MSNSTPKYKKCVVRECNTSTINAPDKTFIQLPSNLEQRQKWMISLGLRGQYSCNTHLLVCEDHFDLENDMENYWRWKWTGSKKKIKSDVVPVISKKARYEQIPLRERYMNNKENETPIMVSVPAYSMKRMEQGIQCKPETRDVGSQIVIEKKIESDMGSTSEDTGEMSISTSEYQLTASSSEEWETELIANRMKDMAIEVNNYVLQKKPMLYMGLPEDCYFIINMLQEEIPCTVKEICIVLKKIRTDRSFGELGDDFGLCKVQVSKIFRAQLPKLYTYLQKFIVKCNTERIKILLPVPFRYRYFKVRCIIDCLEIQIDKPSDAIKQALTWSEYKKGNTMKYLIASTPDGLITFISCGFGGRTSDAVVVQESGFLQSLDPGTAVMADRGFKHIEYDLLQNGCCLVRPPSVVTGMRCSKEEVLETKRIASLRIHIERVIQRLRQFSMLEPHACVNIHQVNLLDMVIVVAGALVNLQAPIIKNAFFNK